MKILHVIHSLSGGGAEKQLSLITSNSQRYGIESSIFCVDDKRGINDFGDVKCITHQRKGNKHVHSFIEIYSAIKKIDPDVVHVWLPSSITIPAMIMARLRRKKIVFSYRNRMFFSRFVVFLEYLVAVFFANAVVSNNTVSHSTYAYKMLFKMKNGLCIRNAIEPTDYQHKSCVTNKISFISFGRLTKQKNYMVVLLALAKLKKSHNWEYNIFGEGEDKAILLEKIAELGLSNHIKIHSFTGSIHRIMSSSDYLIFPSLWEGMPNVLVEAVSIGLPCVVSRIPSTVDVLGGYEEGVFWFDAKSPDMLHKLLKKIINSPKVSIPEKVRLDLINNLSIDSVLEKYSNVYAGLIHL